MIEKDDNRPEPEALLTEAKKEGRGKLKIFLGMAPGVGKTYAMLLAAQQRRREGRDIVVGVVESHGRKETEALFAGMDILPRKTLMYKGRAFEEMDLDAILARKPEIAVVDELAHTNIEGSRHVKRYHDVEEILAAGINVYSTLNIQHLDSLNDVIEKITGIEVRETLPDSVLQTADEIELVDLPPDELIQRLREGKVYMEDQAHLAIRNFFSRGNLTALREMALRTAAERVDRDVIDYLKTHAEADLWSPRDRLLVCVDESGNADNLIRTAARNASRSKVQWIALYVESGADAMMTDKEKNNIAEALSLAEKLGGESVTIRGGANIADDILAFARSRYVTRILIGRSGKSPLANVLFPSISRQLVARAGEFEVTLLHTTGRDKNEGSFFRHMLGFAGKPRFKEFGPPTLAVGGALATSFVIHGLLPVANLSLIFLMPVLFAGVRYGLWPSFYTVFLSFAVYNFFFTEPKYTFSVYHYDDISTLLFFLLAATVTGNLAVRLKTQIEALHASANRNAIMHDFSRKLSTALTLDDVIREITTNAGQSLKLKSALLLPDRKHKDRLAIMAIYPPPIPSGNPPEAQMDKTDMAAADWAFKNDKPAGLGCDTLPGAKWLFKPLRGPHGIVGLMAAAPLNEKHAASFQTPEQHRMLYAFCDQAALAIEGAKLAIDIEESRIQSETEKLRTALLSSISHDLRTPLSSIIGSATTLSHMGDSLTKQNRAELMQNILQESDRLNRFVQNLLDMTKLGHGNLELKREWCGDIRDILGRATTRLQRELRNFKVEYKIDDDVSNLYVDPVLFEQVIVNIVENATKYSKPDTKITISLEKRDDKALLKIMDQGEGIPEADREKVFDMFYRVRAGDSKVAGTGLGLAICRGLVEAHGGTIHAEAGFRGKGAIIVISFPLKMARQKAFYHSAPPASPFKDEEREETA